MSADAFAADPPVASAPATRPADLATLRAERIEVLRRLLRIEQERVSTGRSNAWADVDRRRRMLLEAELDAAASREQRLALLRSEVTAARASEARAEALHDHGRLAEDGLLEVRAARLEAEIRLAKEVP